MSPEYVMDGIFSMKSHVYSFGVLVLEMESAKRNREFRHPDHDLTLLGHVISNFRLITSASESQLCVPPSHEKKWGLSRFHFDDPIYVLF